MSPNIFSRGLHHDDVLRRFDDIATLVNDHLEARVARTEQHRLRDLLISPSVPRWDPFVHGLDFRRTLGGMPALLTAALTNPTAGSEAALSPAAQ